MPKPTITESVALELASLDFTDQDLTCNRKGQCVWVQFLRPASKLETYAVSSILRDFQTSVKYARSYGEHCDSYIVKALQFGEWWLYASPRTDEKICLP